MSGAGDGALLSVEGLDVHYPVRRWRVPPFRALNDVSLRILPGQTLGLVGESGSGKSTLGRAILGLVTPSSGTIRFLGRDITRRTRADQRALSRDLQVVFQDPYTSLNPAMTVGRILAEPLTVAGWSGGAAKERIVELLGQVNLPADAAVRYAREFSGGQRQRVAIARALALEPSLIVCDEPVSALDLSTQARVLDLLIDIQDRTGVSYLFISHDLSVVRHISHEVAVMYRGEIIERGAADVMTSNPEHPYTRRLLLASPVPHPLRQAERRRQRVELAAGTAS